MIANKLSWFRLILIPILLATLPSMGTCSGEHNIPQPILSASQTFFPRILHGVTWKYDEKLMKQRMPGSTIENNSWTGKNGKDMIDSIYSGVILKPLGLASVEIDHDRDNNIDLILIGNDESRAKVCAPSMPKRPRNCRNRLNQNLMNLLAKTERYISSFCGRPKVYKAKEKSGVFPKPGQFPDVWGPGYKWELANAELILGANSDDAGWWSVSLAIKKRSLR